jgi:type IV pilus assembly protein PilB
MRERVAAKLGADLVAGGYIGQKQLQEALDWVKSSGGDLCDYLVEKGYIVESVLAKCLAEKKNLPYVSLQEIRIDPAILKLIPEKVVRRYNVVPIARERRELTVAMANPFDLTVVSDIEFASGCLVVPVVAAKSEIKKAIEKSYQQGGNGYADLIQVVREEEDGLELIRVGKEDTGADDVASAAEEAPIVKLANFIISEAINKSVTDIHIEPFEDELRVRYRIDGVLHQVLSLSRQIHSGLSARIKAMSEMDLSERRRPQEGRLKARTENRAVDMRVNTIPTILGEKIVVRILDEATLVLDLSSLGFEARELALYRKAVQSPQGMVLVSGPTGSGKTTTLYSTLNAVNESGANIMTVEDPVEYHLKGINQVQVHEKAGLTFAGALRAFLRQDPDLILVGDIRDQETAEIAVKAAQTGHLLLSALHANDALSTVAKLINMGIAPYLVASAVILVVSQRLIRKICPECKEETEVPMDKLLSLEISDEELECVSYYQGRGCKRCNHTGYLGRVGLYEVLPLRDEIRTLLVKAAPLATLREAATDAGMRTIKDVGIKKIREGVTTIDEVLRISAQI